MTVTVAEYAQRLAIEVCAAFIAEPDRYAAVRTWEDLHGVCDANDFLQSVDTDLDCEPDSYVDADYVALTTSAIGLVAAWMAAVV